MKKKIAITGGRGRLAGVTAAYFHEQGYEVVLFSRKAGEGMKALDELFDPKVLSSFDILIHAAWSTVPFSSEEDPGRAEREDIPLLKKMLEGLHHLEQSNTVPKLIFLSSASVYGNQKNEPATELAFCRPLSRYARAKLFAERLVLQAAAHDSRLKPVILRVTNLLGMPSNETIPQGVLSKMVAAAKHHQVLEVWGDGKSSKDYLWIDDFLEALRLVIGIHIHGVFNIGSGKNFSLLEFIKIVEETVGQPLSVKYHPYYPWDVICSKISSAAFMKATNWKPQIDITQKIREWVR